MKHPESARFAGALAGLGVVAVAALTACGVLLAFPQKSNTVSAPAVAKPVSSLSNADLIEQLGEPAGPLDCAQVLGAPQGLTGFAWVDEGKGRIVVVCAAP